MKKSSRRDAKIAEDAELLSESIILILRNIRAIQDFRIRNKNSNNGLALSAAPRLCEKVFERNCGRSLR